MVLARFGDAVELDLADVPPRLEVLRALVRHKDLAAERKAF